MDLARYCCDIHIEGDFERAVGGIAEELDGRDLRARRAAIDAAFELLMTDKNFYNAVRLYHKSPVCWIVGCESYVLCA